MSPTRKTSDITLGDLARSTIVRWVAGLSLTGSLVAWVWHHALYDAVGPVVRDEISVWTNAVGTLQSQMGMQSLETARIAAKQDEKIAAAEGTHSNLWMAIRSVRDEVRALKP